MRLNNEKVNDLILQCESELKPLFENLDEISLENQKKVLDAFRKNKLALRHFNGSTGYGYGDEGRDTLKRVYADVFNAEASLISPHVVSGTHAISLGLFAALKSGDNVLSVTGQPYDTLLGIIYGSGFTLEASNISFKYVDLNNGEFDYNKIFDYISKNKVDMIYIQRSRGYAEREAMSVFQIAELISKLKSNDFNGIVFVDNCYGEFCEKLEPIDVGADVICGSLIKNIGGGIAPTGGYIVGKQWIIDRAEERLTAKSIAKEVGSYACGYRDYYQGLFLAPHTVNQALKGSMLIGSALSKLGFSTIPAANKMPSDITRSVRLGSPDKLIKFIQAVQVSSPIDSFVSTEPSEMPGYDDQVIMAAGCFVQGSSIELSADAPMREPYDVYIQGGLTFEHTKIALREILLSLEY